MPHDRAILFTAFEPSGDALAAAVAREIRERIDIPLHALGGPSLATAGVDILEATTQQAVMLGGAIAQTWAHRQRLRRLDAWLRDHPLGVLVPVDSPAANWSICKLVRRRQPEARIVHLVAPQLWAWASWRIGRLRRLTDHVMALLPFEPQWFGERGVKTSFIGHPLFDPHAVQERRQAALMAQSDALPQSGAPRLALLPGSRAGEIRGNLPIMLQALDRLTRAHPQLTAVAGLVDERAAQLVREVAREAGLADLLNQRVRLVHGQADAVIAWADVVLAASGTVILQVAAHEKPEVAIYNVNTLSWHLVGRWLVHTRIYTLPNLIAETLGIEKPVPEIIPHFGDVDRVTKEIGRLLESHAARERQISLFRQVCGVFEGVSFAKRAADILLAEGGWVSAQDSA